MISFKKNILFHILVIYLFGFTFIKNTNINNIEKRIKRQIFKPTVDDIILNDNNNYMEKYNKVNSIANSTYINIVNNTTNSVANNTFDTKLQNNTKEIITVKNLSVSLINLFNKIINILYGIIKVN